MGVSLGAPKHSYLTAKRPGPKQSPRRVDRRERAQSAGTKAARALDAQEPAWRLSRIIRAALSPKM